MLHMVSRDGKMTPKCHWNPYMCQCIRAVVKFLNWAVHFPDDSSEKYSGILYPGHMMVYWGVLKFGFGRDMPPQSEFESRPIQIPIFQEKLTHSYTNWTNFLPNFEQNPGDFFRDEGENKQNMLIFVSGCSTPLNELSISGDQNFLRQRWP